MSEFGFTAMGMLPPDGPRSEEAARRHYTQDELLWMAELEERDFR